MKRGGLGCGIINLQRGTGRKMVKEQEMEELKWKTSRKGSMILSNVLRRRRLERNHKTKKESAVIIL
jgi:hypothetical protein